MEASLATGGNGQEVQKGPEPPEHQDTTDNRDIPEEDMRRAHLYGLLARVLAEPMSDETLEIVRSLDGESDDTLLGKGLSGLGALAVRTSRGVAKDEYSLLFYGAGAGGELLPYGSNYLTGALYEKPLADLRGAMAELGIATSGLSKEPEDHIAFLCEIMHGLITGAFGEPADLAAQAKFFKAHLAPWAGTFFEDLEGAKTAALFMPVGTIGKLFMAIEGEAFEIAA